MKKALFSISYWGPLDYYSALLQAESIQFEQWESFPKQSYRNRCYIASPNGKLLLNIPIVHSTKGQIKDTRIATNENWSQKHWQALKSAYGSSPFFDSLAPELELFYQKEWSFLLDLNLASVELTESWLRLKLKYQLSEAWQAEAKDCLDLREGFHPKKNSAASFKPYPQVFDHKHGFLANLSILDLIFNEGPAAYDYLREV